MQRSKEKLRAMREQLGWTQEQAARKLFVSLATYSRFEREGRGNGREAKNNYDSRFDFMGLHLENKELRERLKELTK